MSHSVQQQIEFDAPAERVYDALMRSDEHTAFTGGHAEISLDVGGAFSCHGGQIEGRNVELIPGRRIVQAWRVANWDAGVYSLVHIELSEAGGTTTLELQHTGCPEGTATHLAGGWTERYWGPLKTHLANAQ